MRIAITGANSSVGQVLLRHVAEQEGLEAAAGVRTQQAAETLPQSARIHPRLITYDDSAALAALVTGASCLVHLAGILIESARSTYQTANVDATRAVVEAARRAAVPHIVLVSAVGADPQSSNGYYRSKGEAERLVADSGIPSSIIRTPILLGPGTAGGQSLVGMASRSAVRVLGGGRHTLRPLDVDDLSEAVLTCCRTRTQGVTTYDLVGPESITHDELIRRTAGLMRRQVSIGSLPVWVAKLGATVRGWLRPGGMTPTVIEVITADESVATNADTQLGIALTPLSRTLEKLVPGTVTQT